MFHTMDKPTYGENQAHAKKYQPGGILAVPYPRPVRNDVFNQECDWPAYWAEKKSRPMKGSRVNLTSPTAQPYTERKSGG